jgi:Abnormal spindle-like microcephaly-assoc'd, ASPM-SPD-2-Hydin/WD40-like Beta Propeller Repeat
MVVASVGWIGEGDSVVAAGPAELISVDPATGTALVADEFGPSVSGDGNIVVFTSFLFTAESTDVDVWVRDRAAGTTTQVPDPLPPFAGASFGRASGGVVSRDSCHVVYWLQVFAASAGLWHIYEWNRCVAGSLPVDISGGLIATSSFPEAVAVSADGRYVAYVATSNFSSLVTIRVARIDTTLGTESVLTHPFDAVFGLDISDDGGFVAVDGRLTVGNVLTERILGWTAPCTQLGSTNVCTTEIVSVNSDEAIASGFSGDPAVSADGRYVAFDSNAPELAGFPSGGPFQVYVRDRVAGVTKLVTETPGQQMPGSSVGDITPDGTQIALTQDSGNESSNSYVAHSTSGFYDTSAFDLVSFGVNDQPVTIGGRDPSMSSTGRYVAFRSRDKEELSGTPTTLFDDDIWLRERPVALDITATLNFGTIDVGSTSAPQNAVVTNTSNVAINIASVTPPGSPFSITGNNCIGVLPAGASCTITVVFRPTAAGGASSSITVSGDGLAVSVSLVGVGRPLATAGTLSINPAAANFGTAAVGASLAARNFTVTNTGQQSVGFSGVSLNGVGSDQFAIVTNTCTGSLAGGATCTISVSSTVTREGSFSAILSITGSGGQSAQATLRVTGTAELFTPTLKMNPGVVSPGEVTAAVGAGFPPDIDVQLAFVDELPFTTVHTDATGAFRFDFLILRNGIRIGGRQILALDQPQFSGVFAPLLIDLATYRPSGFTSPAITSGVRSLFSRGG